MSGREKSIWRRSDGFGVVVWSFKGGKHAAELPVRKGDRVRVLEETKGWFRGINVTNNKSGIFPKNHVQIAQEYAMENSYGNDDEFHYAVVQAMKEWLALLKQLYKDKAYPRFHATLEGLAVVADWRREWAKTGTPKARKEELKTLMIARLEAGRRALRLDFIPRNASGDPLDETNTPIMSLLRIHRELDSREHYDVVDATLGVGGNAPGIGGTMGATLVGATATSTGSGGLEKSRTLSRIMGKSSSATLTNIKGSPSGGAGAKSKSKSGSVRKGAKSPGRRGGSGRRAPSNAAGGSLGVLPGGPGGSGRKADRSMSTLFSPAAIMMTNTSTVRSRVFSSQAPTEFGMYTSIVVNIRGPQLKLPEPVDLECYFSLYNKAAKSSITEQYLFKTNSSSGLMENAFASARAIRAVFTDIHLKDFTGELFLLVQIVRVGSILFDDKEKKGPAKRASTNMAPGAHWNYRRPFLTGLIPINESILNSSQGPDRGEIPLKIELYKPKSESDWSTLPAAILSGSSAAEAYTKSDGMSVGVQAYPGTYAAIRKEITSLATADPVPKLAFPEIILPSDTRNDLYIILAGADVTSDRLSGARNVQVDVQVLTNSGSPLTSAFVVAGNRSATSAHKSFIIYHTNNPRWNELIRVTLDRPTFESAHLLFTFSHVSHKDGSVKPFGFSFQPLLNTNGTAIKDAEHSLPIYKTKPDGTVGAGAWYLSAKTEKGALEPRGSKENLKVSTQLLSTQLTQNALLLSLLQWKKSEDYADTLKKFTFIDHLDIMKFLREILDALFGILHEAGAKNPNVASQVYSALSFVIGIVTDDKAATKFAAFNIVLDTYIDRRFSGADNKFKPIAEAAYSLLLSALKADLAKAESPDHSKQIALRSSLKSLGFMIRFITASRAIIVRKKGTKLKDDSTLTQELSDIHSSLKKLMAKTKPESIIGAQTILLKSYPSLLPTYLRVFPPKEMAKMTVDLLSSISSTSKKLRVEKLSMMNFLVFSELFSNDEARQVFLPPVLSTVKTALSNTAGDDLESGIDVIANMLDAIQTSVRDPPHAMLGLSELLPPMVKALSTYKGPQRYRTELATAFVTMFSLLDEKSYNSVLAEYAQGEGGSGVSLLKDIIHLCDKIVHTRKVYPSTWFILRMFVYQVVLKVMRVYNKTIRSKYIAGSDFKTKLVEEYFRLGVDFVNDDGVNIESFSSAKAKMVETRYGDLRVDASALLRNLWDAIGPNQTKFIPDFVGPFLELTRHRAKRVRSNGFALYSSMLQREFTETGSFAKVERATVDTMDSIINRGLADEDWQAYFTKALDKEFKANQAMAKRGRTFLSDIAQLLAFMTALRSCPETAEYEDERTVAMLKLMAYLRRTDRMETYITYVGKLRDLHLSLKSYTEAGMAVSLYADLLGWSDKKLPAVAHLPEQSERARKERLVLEAIEYLDKGKMWEKAIELLKVLQTQYEKATFEYDKLSKALERQAKFSKSIITVDRFFANFFRVSYYGRGFPRAYQNKHFIYRGAELERMGDFTARIQAKFRHSILIKTSETPGKDITNGDGKYIQIVAVQPASPGEVPGGIQGGESDGAGGQLSGAAAGKGSLRGKPGGGSRRKSRGPAGGSGRKGGSARRPGHQRGPSGGSSGGAGPDRSKMPEKVQAYHRLNDVYVFKHSAPFYKKGKDKKTNQFRHLWIRTTYFSSAERFPTFLRRSEVVDRKETETPPLDNAIQSLEDKNKELGQFIRKHESSDKKPNLNPFSMALNGVIDAAVNGGLANYREAFFAPDYLEENPKDKAKVEKLREVLKEQLKILDKALAVHRDNVPDEMAGFQAKLDAFYDKMKSELAKDLGSSSAE